MTELQPLFHWSVPAPYPRVGGGHRGRPGRGLSARLVRVLSRRGPVDAAALAARFDAPESALHDPRAAAGRGPGRGPRATPRSEQASESWSSATSTPTA